MEKLLLVDGSNLLFQMYYGMPARITGIDGRPIQGTLGFVGALLKILRMTAPSHAAVLFDGECANGRTLLDAAYKANRPDYSQLPQEDTPFSQLPDIYKALDLLGIAHSETRSCETDDWIAGYTLRYRHQAEIVIASFDSDFFQLIGDRVRVLRYRGKNTVLCDRAYIQHKLGIEPEQYAQFKALTGDSADNIHGVPGIGPKNAAALIRQFGTLDCMLHDTAAIQKPSIRAAVEANAERIRTNYALIRLTEPDALPFSWESLIYQETGLTTTQVLQRIGAI